MKPKEHVTERQNHPNKQQTYVPRTVDSLIVAEAARMGELMKTNDRASDFHQEIRLSSKISIDFVHRGPKISAFIVAGGRRIEFPITDGETYTRWLKASLCIAHNRHILSECAKQENEVRSKGEASEHHISQILSDVDKVWAGVTPLIAGHDRQMGILKETLASMLREAAAERDNPKNWAPKDPHHKHHLDTVLRYWTDDTLMPEPAWMRKSKPKPAQKVDTAGLKHLGFETA